MFDGWVPAEVHIYHYDPQGRIDHVEVRRESEWSVEDQQLVEALTLLDSQTCKGCGHSLLVTTDPGFVGLVDHETCYACRSLAIVERDEKRRHEKDPHPAPGRPGWADGRLPWVRQAEAEEIGGRLRPQ